MISIQENGPFTVIVEFKVDPQHQQALLDAIADQVERHFAARYAGFVSSTFHASEDGERILNYAQWESREAWTAFDRETKQDEVGAAITEAVKRYGGEPTLRFFRVSRVVEAGDAP